MDLQRQTSIVGAILVLACEGSATGKSDPCQPEAVMCLPPLGEHGAVANAPPVPPPKKVRSPRRIPARWSRDLAPRAASRHAPTVRLFVPFDPKDAPFAGAIDAQSAALADCRIELARARQVVPGRLPDDEAHVRLWVARDGRVVDSLVSTTGTLGSELRDCVKRRVQAWSLPPPEGGRDVLVDVSVRLPARGRPTVRPAPPVS
jgi:hypothetical protein